MHKVDGSIEAFETDDGLWHLTMFCGVALPLVSGKINRPWTHVHDRLVTCKGCVAKRQGEHKTVRAGRAPHA